MKSSAKLEVQLVVDACLRGGITHVVLSPGSRNAPLSIAFDEHPSFTTFVIPDERSAAFYALGMAQQLQQPVAIACTSGSAPLNYFPAIAEAYYQGVPLVVLTADRPKEWVDQGDGQTIVQENMYGTHVLASAQLSPIFTEDHRWLFERQCAEIIQKANGRRKGPIHLNIPFNEPLYPVTSEPQTVKRWIHLSEGETILTAAEEAMIREKWERSSRRMIICGQLQRNEELEKTLAVLAVDPSVAVLVEHTSNLRNPAFIECIDRTLNQLPAEGLEAFQPDLLIVLGGAIVSKRIKAFLRNVDQLEAIRIGNDFPFMDTFQALSYTSAIDPVRFTGFLSGIAQQAPSDFGKTWKKHSDQAIEKHTAYIAGCAFSDLKVMDAIWKQLPENSQLHIANSSIIRYALLFDPQNRQYWCNRGTSGIDGSSSTVCGAALADSSLHILISGDMSFFYDSNAFWSDHKPANLRVIVLNNGGGDIFNIIPGPDTVPQRERYFVAKQQYSAEHICKAYGVEYYAANDLETINGQWADFLQSSANGAPKLMEIHTAGQENSAILRNYFLETKTV